MQRDPSRGKFSDILAGAGARLRPVCVQLRAMAVSAHDHAFEIVWPRLKIASFGVGPRKMTEHYAYLGVQKTHVNLGFYHGTLLPDPGGLLEGTGQRLRHVKIRSLEPARVRALKKLLRAAVADRLAANTK